MPGSTKPDLQRFLDRLTRRSVLSKEEQQAVLDLPTQAEQIQTNREFVPLGRRVEHTSFVAAGLVGRLEYTGDGSRQITAVQVPGDMCDAQTVVQPVPTWGLQALTVTTILRVPHRSISAATALYPALAEALWRD